jgi:hypothetical protein
LYEDVYATCKFPNTSDTACSTLLHDVHTAVGPHNIYNIYDNCPRQQEWLHKHGKDTEWLLRQMRSKMNSPPAEEKEEVLDEDQKLLESSVTKSGGYEWSCGGIDAASTFFARDDVKKAMHLNDPHLSQFSYKRSGPASITLYPELIKKLDILIYNGDADSCVPYKGNEEWIDGLKGQSLIKETKAWHPWYADGTPGMPAGYSTSYSVSGSDQKFHFVTIRLAGHMVPTFQPEASFSFFSRFLAGKPF